MSTIQDVAKKSGYSIKTISRVMNHQPNVSEKAKRKILEVMKELDYYPNSIAQQMRGKGTKLIGIMVSYITNPFFSYLVNYIEMFAGNLGYQIIVLQTLDRVQHQQKFIDMLKKKQIDGLIIASLEEENEEVLRFSKEGKIVLCNRYGPKELIPTIRIDEKEATYKAIHYLLSQGYTKIAYCTEGVGQLHDHRFAGYMQALDEFKISFQPDYYFKNSWNIADGRKIVAEILAMEKEKRPDAIFSNGDELASGIVSQCNLLKIMMPKELAVIGFDDQPVAEILNPQLTTIRQPIKAMGEYAEAVLIANLENKPAPSKIELKTELIIRGTA